MSDAHKVWVVVNSDGIITGASVDDGRPASKRFLMPVKKGSRLLRIDGPVRMSAHVSNPMVYPPQPIAQHEDEFSLT